MRIKTKLAIAFVVANILFMFWSQLGVPEAKIYFGEPAMPDTRTGGYSPDDVRALLLQIGEQGRATYLVAQKKIDFIIPFLGIGVFAMSIWALAEGLIVNGRRWSSRAAMWLASIGVIGPLFDYAENILVGNAMRAGPDDFDHGMIEIASACTQLKFGFSGLAVLIIAVLALLRWQQSRRERSRAL